MGDLKELKRRKEDFRIEIRKSKQDKTFFANRQRLIQKLFEEEETTSSSSTSSQEKPLFGIVGMSSQLAQQNNGTQQNNLGLAQGNSNQTNISSVNNLKVYLIYSLQEISELVAQFLDYISKSSQQLSQSPSSTSLNQIQYATTQDIQVAQTILKDLITPLMKYEDLFKQINDKNCHVFEQGNVHARLFEYLQTIIQSQQCALSLDLQGAEALLSKVFQYLVNVCLNSDKALEDCFTLNIINYFINVMISSNFYQQRSKMILFSVNLLDHIASRNRENHIKMLTEKEITIQILALMSDIRESIQHNIVEPEVSSDLNNTNNGLPTIEVFYRKILVHLSSILSNISRHKELIEQADKQKLTETCQDLLTIICKDLNDKNKQYLTIKQFYSTLPKKDQNQGQQQTKFEEEGEEDEEEEEITTNDDNNKDSTQSLNGQKKKYRSAEEQKVYDELSAIEINISGSLLNIIEMMETEEVDEYISNNISFLVFAESQILPPSEQTSEKASRIQVYGELMNGLLLGDDDQIELVMETFQILEYIRNMLYSSYQNVIITGLSCLYNILLSASQSQFDEIYEQDKNITCRLLHLINNYSHNTILQAESLNTLSAFVDRAPKSVLDFYLRPSNVMNIIIQKLDDQNDSSVINASLSLLESLLKSEEDQTGKDGSDFDEEEDEMTENNNQQMQQYPTLGHTKDNYWALKFQSNPAGNNQITKLFNSIHSKDIILRLDSILDTYME